MRSFASISSIMRSFYSLSFSLLITFLHIGCCILPLLSLASLSFLNAGFLDKHKLLFTALQWVMLTWLSGRLLAFFCWKKNFHNRAEMLSYFSGWFIALSGLIISQWEPFKPERQVLAEQQFERFRSQRQLHIDLPGTYNKDALVADLGEIDGVRRSAIGLGDGSVTVSYHKDKVSPAEIFAVLKRKGYLK